MKLTDFLLARIAEDEAVAQAVVADMPRWDTASWEDDCLEVGGGLPGSLLNARMSPARVLAECEAKRRIVTGLSEAMAYDDKIHEGTTSTAWAGIQALRHLALPYADHPDYREEWKP